jgi:peroxiredoxin
MNKQAATIGPGAKKGVVLIIVISAVVLLLLLFFSKGGSKGTKIIGIRDKAPEFSLMSLDGKRINLSDYRGKVVMLHFWATWCPPCVEEVPTIETLYRNTLGKDFVILAVSVDEGGAASIRSFMQRNKLSFPVLLDPDHAVSGLYGTYKFPETYIIGRNGIVKDKVIGPRDWAVPAVVDAVQQIIVSP